MTDQRILTKLVGYLRMIALADDITAAQRDAKLALRLIEDIGPSAEKRAAKAALAKIAEAGQ